MPIRVKCEQCKKTLSVKDHLAGKKIKCPVCQNVVSVSAAPQAPPPTDGPTAKPAAAPAPKPAAAPKKSAAATKPGPTTKPSPGAPKTNGTPSPADKAKSNGKHVPIELPPENIEEEAASAFADEPPPPVVDETPKTIDFKCNWCDEDVKLPLELAGKQTQCPNPECRRLIKVPVPKPAEKGDWRKMDRQGPAAARINQPEQLDDAWGTEEATRARQASLAEAGAIEIPKKPRAWVPMILKFVGAAVLAILVGIGGWKSYDSNQQHNALADIGRLVRGKDATVKKPVLLAEAYRTMGLLYLRSSERNPATTAMNQFIVTPAFEESEEEPAINEQLFLIDLALSQIELGGEGDDLATNRNTKVAWDKVQTEIQNTLGKIQNPEVQAMALRAVGSRLIEKKQNDLAIGLTSPFAGVAGARPLPFRQQIALVFFRPDGEEKLKDIAKRPDPDDKEPDANDRVGFAEGDARNEKYDEALKLVKLDGPAKDRLDAALGVAAVAWQTGKKDEALKFINEAKGILDAKDPQEQLSPWQLLQLVMLAARAEEPDAVKPLLDHLTPPFRLRAQLEMFKAGAEKTTSKADLDKLADASLADLQTADKEGTTLALGFMCLAQHSARLGTSLAKTRKDFQARADTLPPDLVETIRPMVDIGWYQGSMK